VLCDLRGLFNCRGSCGRKKNEQSQHESRGQKYKRLFLCDASPALAVPDSFVIGTALRLFAIPDSFVISADKQGFFGEHSLGLAALTTGHFLFSRKCYLLIHNTAGRISSRHGRKDR